MPDKKKKKKKRKWNFLETKLKNLSCFYFKKKLYIYFFLSEFFLLELSSVDFSSWEFSLLGYYL